MFSFQPFACIDACGGANPYGLIIFGTLNHQETTKAATKKFNCTRGFSILWEARALPLIILSNRRQKLLVLFASGWLDERMLSHLFRASGKLASRTSILIL